MMNRRTFLTVAAAAAAPALPAMAQSVNHVTMQLVGIRRVDNLRYVMSRSDAWKRIFDELAQRNDRAVTRQIPLRVYFWMDPNGATQEFRQAMSSGTLVEERVANFSRQGGNLRLEGETSRQVPFLSGDLGRLPFDRQGDLVGPPTLAFDTALTGEGMGWQLPIPFVRACRGVMICPMGDVATLWPRHDIRIGNEVYRRALRWETSDVRTWGQSNPRPTAALMDTQ